MYWVVNLCNLGTNKEMQFYIIFPRGLQVAPAHASSNEYLFCKGLSNCFVEDLGHESFNQNDKNM